MVVSFCGKRILSSRNKFLKIPNRNGYTVLLPEFGENLPLKDPLLKEDKTPEFNTITTEKCIAAIGRQATHFEEGIKTLAMQLENNKNLDIFKDVLNPMEEMYVALEITWGVAKTLNFGNKSLMPTKCYKGISECASKACAHKYINAPIYWACKEIMSDKEVHLTDQQKRVLSKFILEGKLNGLELKDKKASEFMYLSNNRLNKMSEFQEKLEIATKQFTHTIRNPKIVEEFPEDFLKTIAADSTQPTVGPWTITLNPVTLQTFMEFCNNRPLRWKVWEADVTKASLFQDKLLQNSSALEEIRAIRNKQATLLGYKSYADMSMETKMAGTLDNLYYTLQTLLQTARPAQEREIKELSNFANERGLDGKINLWDIPYWSRKQRDYLYKYERKTLRDYFPLPKVLSGLFGLAETLFSVKIIESRKPDVWHKDVRYFDVFDLKKSSTVPVANFYLDPYARGEEKVQIAENSGSMMAIKTKSKVGGTTPLAALIFNFQSPTCEKPSLLSFEDLQVLFKKFGHMLQHLLTTVDYAEISGFSFVEWDAVFISDYFMTHWLYEPSVLKEISGHYDTGESLSMETIETFKYVRSHFAGYNLCKELYLSRLDLELHSSNDFWIDIMNRIWDEYFVLPQHKKDCHVCSFASIFSGNWGAAYYSNIWAEMIAADLFSTFQETSSQDSNQQKELGNRYRETFLSLGGSYPANEIFRKFRGRDPSPKALLNNLGLYPTEQIASNN